jgi:intracellular sulfur oxidation DsrE/DsrF family protein
MKQHSNYSDEHISAYVDGELDNDERTRLLYDEQNDAGLAQRINKARILKEKVQLAYSEIDDARHDQHSFSCVAFARHNRALVASLLVVCAFTAAFIYNMSVSENVAAAKQLIASTRSIAAEQIDDVIGSDKRVVIHLLKYEQNNFNNTIEHLELLLEKNETDSAFSIELVASGQGLKALDASSSIFAERISLLADRFNSLEVVACAKSLAMLAKDEHPVQLLTSIIITPSAAQQVAKRSKQGWSYIKI